MKLHYKWALKDAVFTKDKGTVFSCFACAGGSTMGYKLAGFDVIGCNEIDPKMNAVYVDNHNPKHNYLCDIKDLVKDDNLPSELYNLDILDGSFPCSSFSMVGNREKDWGNLKKFSEGQKEQVLDTLVFDFIDLTKKLKPKIVIAENVKGILLGKSKVYVAKIYDKMSKAGYFMDHFLLNASKMGVPQKRERVFFIAIRKDLSKKIYPKKYLFSSVPFLDLSFSEKEIPLSEIKTKGMDNPIKGKKLLEYYNLRKKGDKDFSCTLSREFNRPNSLFSHNYLYLDKVVNTLLSNNKNVLFSEPRYLNNNEIISAQTFPTDFNFGDASLCKITGMSVPPIMMARIANEVYKQWLSKIATI